MGNVIKRMRGKGKDNVLVCEFTPNYRVTDSPEIMFVVQSAVLSELTAKGLLSLEESDKCLSVFRRTAKTRNLHNAVDF